MLLYVDQLEDVFDLDDAAVKFRKAMATLCDLVSRLPSVVVVISCLSDYYDELKKKLTRPVKDRIENDPAARQSADPVQSEEIVSLIGRRLSSSSSKREFPTRPRAHVPDPRARVSRLVGLRARDVCSNASSTATVASRKGRWPITLLGSGDKEKTRNRSTMSESHRGRTSLERLPLRRPRRSFPSRRQSWPGSWLARSGPARRRRTGDLPSRPTRTAGSSRWSATPP